MPSVYFRTFFPGSSRQLFHASKKSTITWILFRMPHVYIIFQLECFWHGLMPNSFIFNLPVIMCALDFECVTNRANPTPDSVQDCEQMTQTICVTYCCGLVRFAFMEYTVKRDLFSSTVTVKTRKQRISPSFHLWWMIHSDHAAHTRGGKDRALSSRLLLASR